MPLAFDIGQLGRTGGAGRLDMLDLTLVAAAVVVDGDRGDPMLGQDRTEVIAGGVAGLLSILMVLVPVYVGA